MGFQDSFKALSDPTRREILSLLRTGPMTVGEILQHINGGMKNPLSAVKVGLALRKAGFEQVRVAGKRGYRVVMYTIEEVNRNRRAMGRFTEAPAEE